MLLFVHKMKLMRHLRAWIAMVLPCLLAVAHGAEPAGKGSARPQPERWLLILDTSSAMERRAQAVEGLVGELLASGMNGQMAPGADIGIWTYNKELFAGVAPMQTWNPAQSNIIAGRSLAFLSKQKYRSKSRTEPVLSELARVVSDSRQLTVVWFSDSAQKIAGTPFDDLINAAYAKYRPALAKTRMPLVTVLRVHQGKYFAQNISVSPWPIEFPPFPVTENTNEVAKLPPAATPPVKSIFIGREPEKTNVLKSAGVELHAAEVKLRPLPDGVSPKGRQPQAVRPKQSPTTRSTISPPGRAR